MKPKLTFTLLLITLFAVTARADDAVLPLISMESVPLSDAVKNLARQAGTNFILDVKVLQSFRTSPGGVNVEPPITRRWTNSTASAALNDVLKSQKLAAITNSVTGVIRIALPQENAKSISASELGNDTGPVLPLVRMEEVPLEDAIKNLARQAGVAYALDPSVHLVGGWNPLPSVNLRFENITAKKALVALLDAYGLALQNPDDPSAKIINQP